MGDKEMGDKVPASRKQEADSTLTVQLLEYWKYQSLHPHVEDQDPAAVPNRLVQKQTSDESDSSQMRV